MGFGGGVGEGGSWMGCEGGSWMGCEGGSWMGGGGDALLDAAPLMGTPNSFPRFSIVFLPISTPFICPLSSTPVKILE